MKTRINVLLTVATLLFVFALTLNLGLTINNQTNDISVTSQKAFAGNPIIKNGYMSAVCGCGSMRMEDWEACCCPGITQACHDDCGSIQYGCPKGVS